MKDENNSIWGENPLPVNNGDYAVSSHSKAEIVCLDCDIVISTEYSYFLENGFNKVMDTDLKKDFPGHLDHNVQILLPVYNKN